MEAELYELTEIKNTSLGQTIDHKIVYFPTQQKEILSLKSAQSIWYINFWNMP